MTTSNRKHSCLPPPTTLDFPEKFDSWRRHQDDAVLGIAASDKRFIGLVVPTGGGKSLTYMSYAKLSGAGRVCILTSTKSLQDQLQEFKELDVRGKRNYPCILDGVEEGTTVDDAPCQSGFHCELRDNGSGENYQPGRGCVYYDKRKDAKTASVVITNYSYWLSNNIFGQGLGKFDLLVLDEAHAAPDELAGFLSCTVTEAEARSYLRLGIPDENESTWWPWLEIAIQRADREITLLSGQGTTAATQRLKRIQRLARMMVQIRHLGREHWVAERGKRGITWDVTDPAPFAERFLFRGTDKVILSSATVRQKTLELLGVDPDETEMLEYPSTFPVARRPVYVVDGAPRMNYRTGPEELDRWLEIMDTIVTGRRDRRGLIHSVSFKRARDIFDHSEHQEIMVMHGSGSTELNEGLRKYLGMKPAVLVSPSVTTGVDLPGSDAEYCIVSKIPYPDMRSKVLKARSKIDPDYPAYIAAQVMVQATGRGMRSDEDAFESFIVDGNWGWFMRRYAAFTPRWWRSAVKRVGRIPSPPKGLVER